MLTRQLLKKGLVRHKGDVHFAADAAKPAFFRLRTLLRSGGRLTLRVNSWKSSLPVSSETGISQLAQRNRCSSGGVEIDAAHQLLEEALAGHKLKPAFRTIGAKPHFFRLGGDWRLHANSWKSSLPVSSETGISQLTLRNRCSSAWVFGD